MAFACVQGGIRCSFQLSWLNSKVSADDDPRLLSSAEPFHTPVDHRPFNSSTHDSHRSSNSFRGYFVCRASSVAHRPLPITRVTTLDEQVARTITHQRLVAQLSAFFGLLAVFLSCIGIYFLMSYVVSRRTNEIGIRMALGAARFDVSWLVMREIVVLFVAGLAIGIHITLAATRLVANMLYGIHGIDSIGIAGAVLLLLLVAVCAGSFPARRASKVDPMVALRYE